jgi:cysteine desulfurase
VLLAMGADDDRARSSLRFTLGHTSQPADVDALIAALPAVVERARRAGLATVRPAVQRPDRTEGWAP